VAPNGIGFSPDGKTLYLSDATRKSPRWLAFDVEADGTLGKSRVFYDGRPLLPLGPGVPDGLKVDRKGRVFAAGPGGIHVFAPDGARLGFLEFGAPTGNCAFGGPDGSTLFVASNTAIYRVRLAAEAGAAVGR